MKYIIPSSGHSAWLYDDDEPLGPYPIVAFMTVIDEPEFHEDLSHRARDRMADYDPDCIFGARVYALVLDPERTSWHQLDDTAYLTKARAKAACTKQESPAVA